MVLSIMRVRPPPPAPILRSPSRCPSIHIHGVFVPAFAVLRAARRAFDPIGRPYHPIRAPVPLPLLTPDVILQFHESTGIPSSTVQQGASAQQTPPVGCAGRSSRF